MGGGSAPTPPDVGANLERSIGAYSKFGGDLLSAEQKYEPAYSQLLTQDTIGSLGTYAQNYLHKGPAIQNSVLSTNLSGLGYTEAKLREANPDAQKLDSVATNLSNTQNDSNLMSIGGKLAANTRGADFKALQSNVMGKLGTTDPLTQQLQDEASKEVALGGKLSDGETNVVQQESRAADSSRGVFNSNASRSNELLNLDQYATVRQQQRQQFASGVSALADQQTQEKTQAASNLTSLDESLTSQNLTNASSIYANADNLRLAAQQAGMSGLLTLSQSDTGNALNLIGNASSLAQGSTGLGMNSGQSGPSIFNSLGLFGASNSNAQLGYQGQLTAMQTNNANQQSLVGGGIALGGSVVAGALSNSAVIGGIGAGITALI
jgi:hypothetical protein